VHCNLFNMVAEVNALCYYNLGQFDLIHKYIFMCCLFLCSQRFSFFLSYQGINSQWREKESCEPSKRGCQLFLGWSFWSFQEKTLLSCDDMFGTVVVLSTEIRKIIWTKNRAPFEQKELQGFQKRERGPSLEGRIPSCKSKGKGPEFPFHISIDWWPGRRCERVWRREILLFQFCWETPHSQACAVRCVDCYVALSWLWVYTLPPPLKYLRPSDLQEGILPSVSTWYQDRTSRNQPNFTSTKPSIACES